ncbi:MAG: ribosome maturation factor RimP [Gemmatimonadota bacterium]|nr:MAG: ribosome maturation factor RimP [Gemmatimonadota bacterium]
MGELVTPAFLFRGGVVPREGGGKVAGRVPEVEHELEHRVDTLGFELVYVEWAGSQNRPILRIRVEAKDAACGSPIGVGDCVKVSRGLEPWLDELDAMPERYVLEVSSPGLERPLTRPGDWERFVGEPVVVKGRRELTNGSARLEGEIAGLDESVDGGAARIRLFDGEEVAIPLADIKGAHLIFKLDRGKRD